MRDLAFNHFDHTENHGARAFGRMIDFSQPINRALFRNVKSNLALSTFCNRVDYSVACKRETFTYLQFQ